MAFRVDEGVGATISGDFTKNAEEMSRLVPGVKPRWRRVNGVDELTFPEDRADEVRLALLDRQSDVLNRVDVSLPVYVESEGRTLTVEMNAREAYQEARTAMDGYEMLRRCMGG